MTALLTVHRGSVVILGQLVKALLESGPLQIEAVDDGISFEVVRSEPMLFTDPPPPPAKVEESGEGSEEPDVPPLADGSMPDDAQRAESRGDHTTGVPDPSPVIDPPARVKAPRPGPATHQGAGRTGRIVAALEASPVPLRARGIADHEGIDTPDEVGVAISRLVKAGTVVRVDKGLFTLPGRTAEPTPPQPIADDAAPPPSASKATLAEQVAHVLNNASEPMTATRIAATIGAADERKVVQILMNMCTHGLITRTAPGTYRKLKP